jgi:hypothetical protein
MQKQLKKFFEDSGLIDAPAQKRKPRKTEVERLDERLTAWSVIAANWDRRLTKLEKRFGDLEVRLEKLGKKA